MGTGKMVNPNRRMTDLSHYKFTKGKGLPTRDLCDLDDPREMFAWMLVAPPGVNGLRSRSLMWDTR